MPVVEVRAADDTDVEAMAAVYVDAARAGWAHIFDESSLKAIEPPVDRLRAERASADSRQQLLVAERQGRIIGFAVVRPSRDEDADRVRVGELDQLYCDPRVWGQGVGRELMAAAIETLRENRFAEATLWVSELNHRPRRIYEVAGWMYEGVTRHKARGETSIRDMRYRITL
jgi:GNAT superfamily N-acetyltransferase